MENKIRNLDIPKGLSRKGRSAAIAIRNWLRQTFAENDATLTGGCRMFYTPREWQERGESYCRGAELIVVFDGGYMYDIQNEYLLGQGEALNAVLDECGTYMELGTSWYGGIYPA